MHTTGPSGLELAERYARGVVEPLLAARFPTLPYAVGRLGSGSDVLGLDDVVSRDHDWGLRLTLLLPDDATNVAHAADATARVAAVDTMLERDLPPTWQGHPTRFATTWEPRVRQRVEVSTPGRFALSRLGIDVTRPPSVSDWLTLTGQSVLEVTAGPVWSDTDPSATSITALRRRLSWYPSDVWLHVVAADWARLAQELPFVGRTAQRGDDLGSRVVAARLAQTAMHLGFLLERRWPPYAKWLGTAFAGLSVAGRVEAPLRAALAADQWEVRQAALGEALTALHARQGEVGLPVVGRPVVPFWERAFLTVDGSVVAALVDAVRDEQVRRLPRVVGSLEQWVDAVDVLAAPGRRAVLGAVDLDGRSPAGSH